MFYNIYFLAKVTSANGKSRKRKRQPLVSDGDSSENEKPKKKHRIDYFRNMAKIDKTLEELLGGSDMVTPVQTGVGLTKRSHYFKCIHCQKKFLGHSFSTHLIRKHKYGPKTAGLLQSKYRVLYHWIVKKKAGVQKPLPCPICEIWHLRLDAHLKRKHPDLNPSEAKEMINTEREKNWCDFSCEGSGSNTITEAAMSKTVNACPEFQVRSTQPSLKHDEDLTNYVPPNAMKLTNLLREKWNVSEQDYFDFFYEEPDLLLDAFKEHLVEIGIEDRGAAQHRQHVDYVWQVLDKNRQILPSIIFSNIRVIQDMYHRKTRKLIGKGGVEANTLNVRFGSLRKFLSFLRSQGIYAGLSRAQIQRLLDAISDWIAQLKKLIGKRKVKLRNFKLKHLMTARHMITYGRSKHVQNLLKEINQILSAKNGKKVITRKFALQVRNYLMCQLCIMNGLRASNLIELRLKDVENCSTHPEYPGQIIVRNDTYKTATIYGEKLIVIPSVIFSQLSTYTKELRQHISSLKSPYLFVTSSNKRKYMSSADIGSALTASFKLARVFDRNEYQRVCPTRVRVACATYACSVEGVDMGYFANTFMKNMKETTAWHYNLHSSNREALSLAMMIGNSFQVGGKQHILKQEEVKELTNAITKSSLPTKDNVLSWVKSCDPNVDKKEIQDIMDILNEIASKDQGSTKQFYSGKPVESDTERTSASENETDDDEDEVGLSSDDNFRDNVVSAEEDIPNGEAGIQDQVDMQVHISISTIVICSK